MCVSANIFTKKIWQIVFFNIFDEIFFFLQPSQSDKTAKAEIKKYMADLTKARKELKSKQF